MILGQHIFDELTARAKVSPRLRMNLDLRSSPEDLSQRMLNAIEPGTLMPNPSAPEYLRDGGLTANAFPGVFPRRFRNTDRGD